MVRGQIKPYRDWSTLDDNKQLPLFTWQSTVSFLRSQSGELDTWLF